jgi:hypothetical protein
MSTDGDVFTRDLGIYEVEPGRWPGGALPRRRPAAPQPGGDFGLSQNAGMGWEPRKPDAGSFTQHGGRPAPPTGRSLWGATRAPGVGLLSRPRRELPFAGDSFRRASDPVTAGPGHARHVR